MLTFQVTSDNPGLFAAQPTIAADGTLSFTANPGASGTATVTAVLKDNGGAGGAADLPLGPEFRASTCTTGDQATTDYAGRTVATAADGSFVVVWNSNGQDGAFGGVYAQRYGSHRHRPKHPPNVVRIGSQRPAGSRYLSST